MKKYEACKKREWQKYLDKSITREDYLRAVCKNCDYRYYVDENGYDPGDIYHKKRLKIVPQSYINTPGCREVVVHPRGWPRKGK